MAVMIDAWPDCNARRILERRNFEGSMPTMLSSRARLPICQPVWISWSSSGFRGRKAPKFYSCLGKKRTQKTLMLQEGC